MNRYNKYLVFKNADIEKHLSDEQQLKLGELATKIRLGRLKDGKHDQQYVCVAADWPTYEQVWSRVEAFVDGKPNEIEQLQARITELEAHNAVLRMKIEKAAKHVKPTCFDLYEELEQALASTSESALADIRRAEREQVASYVAEFNDLPLDRDGVAAATGMVRIANEAITQPTDLSALEAMIAQAGVLSDVRCPMCDSDEYLELDGCMVCNDCGFSK